MSKNLTRKGLAFGTAVVFGVTGLTGFATPAFAAGEVISVAPTTGTGYAAYDTDFLSVTAKIDTNTYVASADQLAINIDSADKTDVVLKLSDGLAQGTWTTATNPADYCTFALPVTFSDDLGNTFTPSGGITTTVLDSATSATLGADADCVDVAGGDAEFTLDFTAPTGSSLNFTHVGIDLSALAGRTLNVATKLAATTSANADVTAWLDIDNDEALESTDKFPSKTEKVTFYDPSAVTVTPRIERFVYDANGSSADGETFVTNAEAGDALGVSLAFSPALNLDQVVLSNLSFKLDEDVAASSDAAVTAGTDSFTARGLFAVADHSDAGKIYGTLATTSADDDTDDQLDVLGNYVVTVIKENGATDPTVKSGGYQVPAQTSTSSNVTAISSISATPAVDNKQTDSSTYTFDLRTGAKSFSYVANAGTAKAGISVIALVQPKVIATGGSITAAGVKTALNNVALVSGTTDADGKFSVAVASDLAKAGESYKVTFYVLKTDGTWAAFDAYTATYAAAAPTTVTPSVDILGGADVSVNFTVKDQFGQLVSATTAGKALYVEAKASNTTNLKSYVAVTAGVAALTFKNYLAVGGYDSVTWTLGTGANATDFASASVATGSLPLYNAAPASAVNAIASVSTSITYDDFITGAATATNVAPNEAAAVISGTVVDANGAGIPGASVTVAASGLQFQKTGGNYYVDSITVAADAAGAFSVNAWAHVAKSAGIAVTITSGGKTATSTLKTYLPGSDVNGNNLVFSWALPALLVKNTTYAVTAKLADKWGNAVATATNSGVYGVTFQGLGSVEVNSSSSAVSKNFDKNGAVTVFVRSVKDIAGPGSIEATLGAANYTATSSASATALVVSEIATNLTATKWDETLFKNVLSADVDIRDAKPTATVAAASKAATVVVKNSEGLTVTVVSGTKSVTKIATSNNFKLSLTKLTAGKKTVKVYVNDILFASKSVTVKK